MIENKTNIRIEKVSKSKLDSIDLNDLKFGRNFSDHMFVADYKNGEWISLDIKPYENITISPASSFIHYGQSIFEGMKAYKNNEGRVFLFRPEMNWRRFNQSALRMCMPEVPHEVFMDALFELIKLDRNWVPSADGSSLYIRPFMFGTDAFLGVKSSDDYRFMIITSPSSAYYKAPLSVKVETEFTRAARGGVGAAKAAGNYAASMYPTKLAEKMGYQQLLWTDAKTHTFFEESGTMNVMFIIGNTLITPALTQTILSGVTRDSVLQIARDWGYNVEERPVSISEIIEAAKSKKLKEVFGTGTAATIAHIINIGYEGVDYNLPDLSQREFSPKVAQYLENLRKGLVEDKYDWVVEI
jgi:branched-chain amino acid aminotransferase